MRLPQVQVKLLLLIAMEVMESLQRMAIDVRGGMIENCGHWMPEEQPAELLKQLLAFFA